MRVDRWLYPSTGLSMANRYGQKGCTSPCLQNTDGGTSVVGLVGVWWWRMMIWNDAPEQRWLPSGLAGTASGRWGRSACGTRLWPACWTWGWSRRAEPPAPTPCRGCSHPDLKSWPPQPPYMQQGKGEGDGTEKKQSVEKEVRHTRVHVQPRESPLLITNTHKFWWKPRSCLSGSTVLTQAWLSIRQID